ncbi:MAG: IS3 family transposase [Mycoplasmataceae bacterium]|nr:IS3 family transposase [Mycoplasmataceae bacterium]
MKETINWKLKFEYILKYVKGMSKIDISEELILKGIIKKNVKYTTTTHIDKWIDWYKQYGILGLVIENIDLQFYSMSKNPKEVKRKVLESLTKDELIDLLEVIDYHIPDVIEEHAKKIIKKTHETKNISLRKLFMIFSFNSSTYFKWNKPRWNANRDKKWEEIIHSIYEEFKGTYGHRRITIELHARGYVINRKKVRRIMVKMGLFSIIKIGNRRSDPKDTKLNFPDLIKGSFKADNPNEKIYTDVTYIATPHATHGFFYFSGVIDGYDNSFAGPAMSINNNTELVLDTFNQLKLNSTIIHSDRGSQYGSFQFLNFLGKSMSKSSMGRRGVSLDNRPIEYFWSNLKDECINQIPYKKRTFEEVWTRILEYIKTYNEKRRQSCLNNLSPLMYRQLNTSYNFSAPL